MTDGEVKFYNPLKGFGFIKGFDRDYFFHVSELPKNYAPKLGDEVEFTPVKTKRGWAAHAITVIKENKDGQE